MHNLRNNENSVLTRPGALYIVATPIGNLDDLGQRARQILARADTVLAEDTRHSQKLLAHYGISRHLISLHEHNEQKRVPQIIDQLREGACVALISDAGTPLISDPGYWLVTTAHRAEIPVISIPGPSAVSAALSIAGLPVRRFSFEGFAPPRKTARRALMQSLAADKRTLVFFEAPHRIKAFLEDAVVVFGADRPACLVKEISKVHEMSISSDLHTLRNRMEDGSVRDLGEFVIVISGAAEETKADAAEVARTLRLLLDKLPTGTAVGLTARISRWDRKAVYDLHQRMVADQNPSEHEKKALKREENIKD